MSGELEAKSEVYVRSSDACSKAKLRVLVYTDEGRGASPNFVAMVMDSLQRTLPDLSTGPYLLQTTNSDEIRSGNWMSSCRLLVMPGGRDLPYVSELAGQGNTNIREFVSSGGSYLGICAGGYYGCAYVEFAKGDPKMEVDGPRELKFFPGIGRGPKYPGFKYESNAGARAASVTLNSVLRQRMALFGIDAADGDSTNNLSVFYNGGGTFVPYVEDNGAYRVRANYADTELDPCIVLCTCGKGKAVLSGVHFEVSTKMLRYFYPDDEYIASLLPQLEPFERQRETLFRTIVQLLLE